MAQRSSTSRRGGSWDRPAAAALLSVLLASPASQAASDAFSQHFQAAKVCFDKKEYDCVISELRAAYKLKPQAALLLNIGHAYLDSGRPALALEHYDWYLSEEKSLSPEVRADVEKFREQARQQIEAQRPVVPPPPPPVATPTATTERPAGKRSPPVAPIVLMSSGAALAIVGIALGGAALAAAKDVVAGNGPFDQALDERGKNMDKAGIALDAIGATLFVAGAAWGIGWLVTAGKRSGSAPIVKVLPAPGGAFVVGRF